MNKTIGVALLTLMLAGPAAGQEWGTSPEQVRAILDDLRDWPPDSKAIPKKVARKWGKDKGTRKKYAELFAEGGELQTIEFIDAFDHGDAYMIEFENARVMLVYVQEPKKRWRWRTMFRLPR